MSNENQAPVSAGLTIGHKRLSYLDGANILFTHAQTPEAYLKARDMLENFLDTIPDEHQAANHLKDSIQKIVTEEEAQLTAINETLKDVGYLENKDSENARFNIEIDSIRKLKIECWIVALKYNLFYDR